ncbi:TetR/AcrR family transcriptional regulator [Paenibacillus sp. R14(2021)]|uniref:TetR/AcrR family transcriptional regulator n=1 Tax=Paenibacillus sp. R14(2021) TaxID=2859228 RepID=UPI0021580A4C|nr:TetR/AcrR family transcriptional regulator [Paenibacillus sp. R14(2021)]
MAIREDRKEQIMDKALGIFAERGYYKATTALVAKAAGVTQPYVFHFFLNKKALYIALLDRAMHRIYDLLEDVEAPVSQLENTLGSAFRSGMSMYRDEILLVMQSYSISEPVIREHARALFQSIHDFISVKFQKANVPNAKQATSRFMAAGYLITVSEMLDVQSLVSFKTE